MAETLLRLFVSSPSDVADERARVEAVARKLDAEFAGRARIDVFLWEDAFYSAARSFQAAIEDAVQSMRATDMVVGIVWKRVGTPLDPAMWQRPDGSAYESGTVLEVEQAVAAARDQGAPDVYLFRKTAPVLYSAETVETERAQHTLLETVWKRWTMSAEGHNVAGHQTFATPDDFATKLEACLRQWLARKGFVARGPVWDRINGSPFPGLDPFDAAHRTVFFGRDLAVAHATSKLRAASERGMPFLLIIGASGVGKSSLLRAGLLPRLTAPGTIAAVDSWRTALVVAGPDPLAALAMALFADTALGAELRQGDCDTPAALRRLFDLTASGNAPDRFDAAVAPVGGALRRVAEARAAAMRYEAPRPVRLALALDQTERLFAEATPARAASFAGVVAALIEKNLAYVVAALRSDAYPAFQLQPDLLALRTAGEVFDLVPPSRAELREIVTRPVAACRPPLTFEVRATRLPLAGEGAAQGTTEAAASLADVLVAEARGGDALALLQMTLARLYAAEAARGDGMLRFADYRGIAAAVTETAEDVLDTLSLEARTHVPALITGLLEDVASDPVGGSPVPVLAPLDRQKFEQGGGGRRALVDAFVARRLLTIEGEGGAARLRPVHEALLRIWPQAVRVVAEVAHLIRVRHALEPIVRDWVQAPSAEKARHAEISTALLAGAQQMVARFGADVPKATRDFVAVATAAAEARTRRERRVARWIRGGFAAALLLAALAVWQWRVAENARTEAQTQRDRAEHTLALATETANGLIFDIAQKFRNVTGVPASTIKAMLDRARTLQEQLLKGGESSPELLRSRAAALDETAETLLTLGDTNAALAAATQARDLLRDLLARQPASSDLQRDLSVSYNTLGDILAVQGKLPAALENFRAALAIGERLAKSDPGKAIWQRDLSVSYERVGDVVMAQGNLPAALGSFRAALAIRHRLATSEPENAGRQHDLSASYDRLGAVAAAQGNLPEALRSFRAALVIRDRLAASDPGNGGWQRYLSLSHEKVGGILVAQGNLSEALTSFRASVAIRERLARSDPGNAEWQRNLAVAYSKVGDVLTAQGNLPEALRSFRAALAIVDRLAKSDPGNAGWQYDLGISNERIGDAQLAQGDLAGALASYTAKQDVIAGLAKSAPDNAGWQRDHSVSYNKVGDVLVGQGKLPEALKAYREGLAIADRLAKADPGNAAWQRDLSVCYERVGDSLVAQGTLPEALVNFRAALAIRERLANSDPGNGSWQRDLAVSWEKIGDAEERRERAGEAQTAYANAFAIYEALLRAHPDNTEFLVFSTVPLMHLGTLDAVRRREYFARALRTLKDLDVAGRLEPARRPAIDWLEGQLKQL